MANLPRPLTPNASPRDFFGAELRRLRELAGLGTTQLGELVHYSGDLIAKVEKAERWPKPELAKALDEALSTDGSFMRLLALVEAQRASEESGAHEHDESRASHDEARRTLSSLIEAALADSDDYTGDEHETPQSAETRSRRTYAPVDNPAALDLTLDTTSAIAHRLIEGHRRGTLSALDLRQLGLLAGQIVDLDYSLSINIDRDGSAMLQVDQTVVNLTSRPVARFVRDFWFKHADGGLTLTPLEVQGGRLVAFQPIHKTPNFTKFACLLSPPLQPGESATIGYGCEGGRFVDDYYWRQSLTRFAQKITLSVRHQGARPLLHCSAVEEFVDGSEVSALEDLTWGYEDDDVTLSLTRYSLHPNQALTVRWEATT